MTQVLRVIGLADDHHFRRYHEVLSRARWDARGVSRRRLLYIIDRLLPDGEVVIGIDDTIERPGVRRSRPATSIVTRFDPRRGILSKPVVCVGSL